MSSTCRSPHFVVVATLTSTLLASSALAGSVLYVDDDAGAAGDGSSWVTAYQFLQDALAAASAGTEIRVAQGVYRPDQDEGGNVTIGDRTATFQLIIGVALRGGYAGIGAPDPDERDIELYESILLGDLGADDVVDLLTGIACFSSPGFPHPAGCEAFDLDRDGDVDWADLGMDENSYHVVTANGTDATAILDGFTITSGTASDTAAPNNRGGGILNDPGGSPSISNCTIKANLARVGGGLIHQSSGSPTLTNCTFQSNAATEQGGAVFTNTTGNPVFKGCSFIDNVSNHQGGAMWIRFNATLVNCVFRGNTAQAGFGQGGAIYAFSGTLSVTNATFRGNTAIEGGALYNTACGAGPCTTQVLTNCILWSNSASGSGDEILNFTFGPTISYSNIGGSGGSIAWNAAIGTDAGGNIDADPLFISSTDLRLTPGSPSIDPGDNTAVPVGTTTDAAGKPRFIDDPCVVDGGVPDGTNPMVDMGAYEFQVPCRSDVDCTGTVNVLDLIEVLLCFGQPAVPGCETADINQDGTINVLDLIEVLLDFGLICPQV